jgi:hypothetical protein
MSVLIIREEERQKVHELVSFAAKPENHYKPGAPGAQVPGDNPRYRIQLSSYRCVFTFTEAPGKPPRLYRHLTISVARKDKFPHSVAVAEIAHLFGFKGKLGDWQGGINEQEQCVVVAQEL